RRYARARSASFPASRKRIAVLAIGRRRVEVQRAQERPARVADLMALLLLDEEQAPRAQRVAPAVHLGLAAAGEHAEPLVRAAMPIARIALGAAGLEHHLGCLGGAVAGDYAEP